MCERSKGNVKIVFCVRRPWRSALIACVVGVMVFAAGGLASGEIVSKVLSEDGCGRATAYAEFNKIVSFGGKTHVSWLDSKDGKFVVKVRTLDRETGVWSQAFSVGEAYDNHGGPSMVRDSEGYLHIVYYPHHHPFRYRRSVRPNDASEWEPEVQFGKKCTYSSMVCMPDDRLVLACRESSSRQWVLNLYEKRPGEQWEGPRTILHGNGESGYVRWQASLAVGPDGETIHMSFMIYEQKLREAGYAVGYLRSPDGGKTWQISDGTAVELPANPATIDIIEGSAADDGVLNFRPGNVAVDEKGTPWVMYARLDRQPYETWVAHPTGDGEWEKRSLLAAVQHVWPDWSVKTPGEVVFDRDGVMFAAVTTVDSAADAETAFWGDPSAETALLVSTDKGRTFKVIGVSKEDKTAPNWLCNIERPMRRELGEVTSLIYTHGLRGETNKDILSNEVVWCDVRGRNIVADGRDVTNGRVAYEGVIDALMVPIRRYGPAASKDDDTLMRRLLLEALRKANGEVAAEQMTAMCSEIERFAAAWKAHRKNEKYVNFACTVQLELYWYLTPIRLTEAQTLLRERQHQELREMLERLPVRFVDEFSVPEGVSEYVHELFATAVRDFDEILSSPFLRSSQIVVPEAVFREVKSKAEGEIVRYGRILSGDVNNAMARHQENSSLTGAYDTRTLKKLRGLCWVNANIMAGNSFIYFLSTVNRDLCRNSGKEVFHLFNVGYYGTDYEIGQGWSFRVGPWDEGALRRSLQGESGSGEKEESVQ